MIDQLPGVRFLLVTSRVNYSVTTVLVHEMGNQHTTSESGLVSFPDPHTRRRRARGLGTRLNLGKFLSGTQDLHVGWEPWVFKNRHNEYNIYLAF